MKQKIINKYGKEPTICFFYYLWNAIEYAGEDWVRESFESIKGQGNEIIVGDYSSNDGTPELAKEYGFKVFNIEKTEGILFHTTKIINKIIFESKSNFIADLDVHITYPDNMDEIIRNWIINNDISKKQLVIGGLYLNRRKVYSVCSSGVFYRPYLLESRGYDERTYYRWGDSHYTMRLLEHYYKLKIEHLDIDNMVHKDHREACEKRTPREDVGKSMRFGRSFVNKLDIKKVQNSYW